MDPKANANVPSIKEYYGKLSTIENKKLYHS